MRERKEETSTDKQTAHFGKQALEVNKHAKKTALRNKNQASAQKVREASKKAREESKGSPTSFVWRSDSQTFAISGDSLGSSFQFLLILFLVVAPTVSPQHDGFLRSFGRVGES
jgi:hypothetical protein